jgi:hypothetical protein
MSALENLFDNFICITCWAISSLLLDALGAEALRITDKDNQTHERYSQLID